jgi:hypothetical protein
MKSRQLLIAGAVAMLFAGPGIAAGDKSSGSRQDKQSAAGGASASANAPMIVLVPMVVATRQDFSNGCWARLYDSTDFQGNQLSLVGPVDMANMRTAFGTDWSGQFDSIQVGPKARLTVYDNENYGEKAATFKSGQKVADLDEKMGTFENISSVKVACTGGAKTAQQEQGGGAATGGSGAGDESKQDKQGAAGASAPQPKKQPFAKLDTDGDGILGHAEAAADKDAASRFHEIDTDDDQKVSKAEYEAWNPGGGAAATGGTAGATGGGEPKK